MWSEFTVDDGCEDDSLCHPCAHDIAGTQISKLVSARDLQLAEVTRQRDEPREIVEKCKESWARVFSVSFDEEIAFLRGEGPDPDPIAQKLAIAVEALEYYEAIELRALGVDKAPATYGEGRTKSMDVLAAIRGKEENT